MDPTHSFNVQFLKGPSGQIITVREWYRALSCRAFSFFYFHCKFLEGSNVIALTTQFYLITNGFGGRHV
jgi:hypothetical protein